MADFIIIFLYLIIVFYLIFENKIASKNRKKFSHIIHVNGTRGKSTTTRLIDAGLRSGGYRVFSKTTGTLPMYIDTNREEILIRRKGPANIKEQLKILNLARKQNAEILVIECMAVDPELQKISQEKILKSDIGVITNVRRDHIDVMGKTLEEICDSLCNSLPTNGIVFTADTKMYERIKTNSENKNSISNLAIPKENLPDIDFPENLELALEVCEHLGVERNAAIEGMKNFKHDPFDLRIFNLKNGAVFINGFSINDPDSTLLVYEKLKNKLSFEDENLILLINNRPDRGYRAEHMVEIANTLSPKKVLLTGSFVNNLKKKINCKNIEILDEVENFSTDKFGSKDIIFAIGNIADNGKKIIEKVKVEIN